jgi:hypothetical protein
MCDCIHQPACNRNICPLRKPHIDGLRETLSHSLWDFLKLTTEREMAMACQYAKFDAEDCQYTCNITGDRCFYFIPNEKKCMEEFEGELEESEV